MHNCQFSMPFLEWSCLLFYPRKMYCIYRMPLEGFIFKHQRSKAARTAEMVFSLNYILGSCLDRPHGERTRDISRVLAEIKLDQVRDNRKSPSVRRTRRDDFELESSHEEKDRAYMHDSQNRDTGMGAGYASSRGQGLHSGVSASQGE